MASYFHVHSRTESVRTQPILGSLQRICTWVPVSLAVWARASDTSGSTLPV